ncbi:MAG: ParB N-terminal domain-containing protein [Thermoguttaceae bacterium]|jgi:ParB-like chromosome segregation protein Spo0J
MKIEERKLSKIIPSENNPLQNDAAVDAVAASIKEFGFRQPIVVATQGVIICGHNHSVMPDGAPVAKRSKAVAIRK